MKKWIRGHGRIIAVIFAFIFIGNGILEIIIATETWKIMLHLVTIALWVVILLLATGAITKLSEWWDKE